MFGNLLSRVFHPVRSLRTQTIDLSEEQCVLLISDVHLGAGSVYERQQCKERLLRVLRQYNDSGRCGHVVIVGDLFDMWFDYPHVVPGEFVQVLALLGHMREQGIAFTYVMGNHDFGHYRYFGDALGITVDDGDVEVTIAGQSARWYVCHGDGKVPNDMGYLMLRSVLRSTWAKFLYRLVHPSIGIALATWSSRRSRTHTSSKEFGQSDGLALFAQQKIAEGYTYVVMGHCHRPQVQRFGHGTYVNLGAWHGKQATYAEYTHAGGMVLCSVD
jgi:UDP-2,3-diacylglucosamine hydrolase